VFYYDRLGLGKSSMFVLSKSLFMKYPLTFQSVSGYVAQVSIQEAILEQLVTRIRSGAFGEKPKHVVLLGHSFGSVISNDVLVKNPGLVDAAILTGIGYENPSNTETFLMWQPKLARLQSPARWGQLDGGYITWVDVFANIATYV
jgi:pimeloyl-ACP methyl ester carboxylesterase